MIKLKYKHKIIPRHSLVENDEYFYRHPEMFRSHIEDDVFDLNKRVVKKIEEDSSKVIKNDE